MRTSQRPRLLNAAVALVGATMLLGLTAFPAAAAPPSDVPPIYGPGAPPAVGGSNADKRVPTFKLPGCSGMLSPEAPTLFGAPLFLVPKTDDGTRSSVISTIIAANRGTICAWRVGKTTNYIQFSATPISEFQREQIIADWVARFGIAGFSVGGRNLIFSAGDLATTESAMLLEEGIYITATPVDGTMFPAFIQAQGDHFYDLIH